MHAACISRHTRDSTPSARDAVFFLLRAFRNTRIPVGALHCILVLHCSTLLPHIDQYPPRSPTGAHLSRLQKTHERPPAPCIEPPGSLTLPLLRRCHSFFTEREDPCSSSASERLHDSSPWGPPEPASLRRACAGGDRLCTRRSGKGRLWRYTSRRARRRYGALYERGRKYMRERHGGADDSMTGARTIYRDTSGTGAQGRGWGIAGGDVQRRG